MSDIELSVGGERSVSLRDGSGWTSVWPLRQEVTDRREEIYRATSERLAELCEREQAPWMVARDPGHALPESPGGRPWSGPNGIVLAAAADSRGYSDPRWGTAEAIAEEGGSVRPGEKPASALHWRFGGRDPASGERWPTRVFRYHVYNAEQCERLPSRGGGGTRWAHRPPVSRILAVPAIEAPAGRCARYDPGRDRIQLPGPEAFAERAAYARVAVHEVGHWTGHPERLNRPSLAEGIAQGVDSRAYAREELRAELHSYLSGCRLAIGHDPERHARFGGEWAAALREDPREFYRAAWDAERISRYVTVRMPEMQPARAGDAPGRAPEQVPERAHPAPERGR